MNVKGVWFPMVFLHLFYLNSEYRTTLCGPGNSWGMSLFKYKLLESLIRTHKELGSTKHLRPI